MKTRFFSLILLIPLMVLCGKQPELVTPPEVVDKTPEEVPEVTPPEENPDDKVAAEVKDGDRILVTNEIVEKFITTIHYPERDYTYSAMRKGEEAEFLTYVHVDDETGEEKVRLYISPGKSDLPPVYTIRWAKDTESSEYTARLWEGDWSADYTLDPNPDPEVSFGYWQIRNLRPNATYHFEVKNGSSTVTSGSFETYGSLHQLSFKPSSTEGVRNVRDLGGWKTKDGAKTVKYRKIYRGGRPEAIKPAGVKEAKDEGIRAELDLRGWSYKKDNSGKYILDENGEKIKNSHDFLDKSPFEDAEFLAPEIDEGYASMLRDDQEKTRQCMQFIMDMVDQNKPVYFHCSLGRDRTGTVALLTLGILGVDEGDISKEYELTQFAPYGYSVSSGETTRMTRLNGVDYDGAAKYLWAFGKQDDGTYLPFKDCVQKYLVSIGISAEDIEKFRDNMLE